MKNKDRKATVKLLRQIDDGQLALSNVIEDISIRFEQGFESSGFSAEFDSVSDERCRISRFAKVYFLCLHR